MQFRIRTILIVTTMVAIWLGIVFHASSAVAQPSIAVITLIAILWLFSNCLRRRMLPFSIAGLITLLVFFGFTVVMHWSFNTHFESSIKPLLLAESVSPEKMEAYRVSTVTAHYRFFLLVFPILGSIVGLIATYLFWIFTTGRRLADRALSDHRAQLSNVPPEED